MVLVGPPGVQSVYCATNVFPLRDFDRVGEDLDAQWPVGNLLSIGIQLCWCWVAGRWHLLGSFP